MSLPGTFSLNSAYLSAPWNTHVVDVEGLLAGNVIYNENITVDLASPQLFTFNFNNIDSFIINPNDDWVTVDNITVTGVGVPDGGLTMAMLGIGMGGLALIRRKL